MGSIRPVNKVVNPQGEVARDRATTLDKEAEGWIIGRGEDPAIQGIDPRPDHTHFQSIQLVMDAHRNGEEGSVHHHPHHPQVCQKSGILTGLCWMMKTRYGGRRGNLNETLKRNMSRSSSGGFAREPRRWLGKTFSMLQPTRESRTSCRSSNTLVRMIMESSRGGWTTYCCISD